MGGQGNDPLLPEQRPPAHAPVAPVVHVPNAARKLHGLPMQALRDDYLSSHCLNCCVWPYESGEVIVQVRPLW